MSDTIFAYFKGTASNADDTDPETSSVFYNPPISAVHNVSFYRRETIELDATETRVITLPSYAVSDWIGIMAKVVGEAKITTVGVNWNGSTPIEGVTAGYGVARYPGYISMVTTNVTSFTITAIADGTTVEYLAMVLLADNQL